MKYNYIDTHAHLNLGVFKDDVDAVAEKCAEKGVGVINVGTKLSTSMRAVELAEKHENCYAIIGLHPIQTTQADHDEEEIGEGGQPFVSGGEDFDTEAFRESAKHEKVVGIGETGFDFYRCDQDTMAVQEEQFIKQIKLANELNLPLMIHTRNPNPNSQLRTSHVLSSRKGLELDAYDEVYRVLKQYAKVPFNVHFYAGTYDQAKKFFDLGGTISFTGVITFAKDYEEVVESAPLDLIHGETDCPFVAPVPHRGKRAEPWMVLEVYKKIAELKGEDEETVRPQLLENAQKLYRF